MNKKIKKKKEFWVEKKLDKSSYSFWGQINPQTTFMSLNFQFKHFGSKLYQVFERYCYGRKLDINKKQVYKNQPFSYNFQDLEIRLETDREKSMTKITFLRSYNAKELTREDFVYFKNTVKPLLNFISNYNNDGKLLVRAFQHNQYRGLVEIIQREKNYEEMLVDEMAFLIRNKDDFKKVKMSCGYIRWYAEMVQYNPEEFIKKELGDLYSATLSFRHFGKSC